MATNNNLETQTPAPSNGAQQQKNAHSNPQNNVHGTAPQQGEHQGEQLGEQQGVQANGTPENPDPLAGLQEQVAAMMQELTDVKVDNKKLKRANDNLASENASLKKQVNAKLTEEELRAQQKSDELEDLRSRLAAQEKINKKNEATKRYMSMKMGESLAEKLANAELEGDMETVTSGINSFMEAQMKEVEERVKAEIYATMPAPASGNGDGQIDYAAQYNEKLAAGDVNGAILAQLEGAMQAAQ